MNGYVKTVKMFIELEFFSKEALHKITDEIIGVTLLEILNKNPFTKDPNISVKVKQFEFSNDTVKKVRIALEELKTILEKL